MLFRVCLVIYQIFEFISSFVINIISITGYLGIAFFMTLESAAIPIPSEIIMPFSGFLVWEEELQMVWVILAGAIGNLIGSIILYWVGFYGGRKFLEKYGRYLLISYHDLELADKLFSKYGQAIIFLSRVLPVVRTYISFPAGVAKMDFKKFCLYTFAGSLPWAWVLTYFGMIMGENWARMETYFRKFDLLIGVFTVLFIIWWVRRHIRLQRQYSNEAT